MTKSRVRRGAPAKGRAKSSSVKKAANASAGRRADAHRLAAWGFGGFVALTAAVAAYALELPSKAGTAAGEALGDAGFRVRTIEVEGTKRMDPKPIYAIALDQQAAALPLVDVGGIREQLLQFGWVKDARVMRRYPDTLVVDIVERKPAALWQDQGRLNLVDETGIVLDRVPVSRMPDLPLLNGPGANSHAASLGKVLAAAPTIRAQMLSASWVGDRRWDLKLASGETMMLPEGEAKAIRAVEKFVAKDKKSPLLGQGYRRFDLRIEDKMVVELANPPKADDTAVPKS